jgi:putative Mn2+ efflux pump MntP
MLALLLLAVAVGLSNFAASIGIGVSGVSRSVRIRVGVVFGLFEAGMPVAGLVLGRSLAADLGQAARWLGAGVLIAVGVAGLLQAWRSRDADASSRPTHVWRTGRVLISGLALSSDNLAAGFVLGAYHTGLPVAAAVFGVVSVAMSLAGLELGARIGIATGDRSELIASAMLIAVGTAIAAGAFLRHGGDAMERMTRRVRQNGMMSSRQVRGIVVAGLLCAGVAGCGSTVATTPASVQAAQAAPAVGCASVNQATTVTIYRTINSIEPNRAGAVATTQRKAALVRALFNDLCQVVAHPYTAKGPIHCPAAFGLAYTGTFYDGNRKLATFTYGASGCQNVRVNAADQSRYSMVAGSAASAAPDLETDMAAVLGLPKSTLFIPMQQVNPGGPNQPAKTLR